VRYFFKKASCSFVVECGMWNDLFFFSVGKIKKSWNGHEIIKMMTKENPKEDYTSSS